MNTESPIYSPGDTAGIYRFPARNYVGSTFAQQALLTGNNKAYAIAGAVAVAVIFLLGRMK